MKAGTALEKIVVAFVNKQETSLADAANGQTQNILRSRVMMWSWGSVSLHVAHDIILYTSKSFMVFDASRVASKNKRSGCSRTHLYAGKKLFEISLCQTITPDLAMRDVFVGMCANLMLQVSQKRERKKG